ncbi:unnamed protein product [Durusdinium trenchii]|uniref:Uncharacterized protein n=1 Tax=Durusdinium trenchii TaxID=1381693 RepID=A0ABP0NGM6_9DINO
MLSAGCGKNSRSCCEWLEHLVFDVSGDSGAFPPGSFGGMRQVEEKLGKRYLHTAPAKALEKAEKSFSEAAKELLRPDSEWSYEPAQKDFSNDFAQALRHQVSLSHERMRTAQTQRATADVIGKIQKQLDSFADKLRGTTSGPWSLWTSYRLPGTPIQVSGRSLGTHKQEH